MTIYEPYMVSGRITHTSGDGFGGLRLRLHNITTDEYIEDVFKKAQINKASKIYEHGISLEKTAKLLGVSMFDLASYTGQAIADTSEGNTISVKTRIKNAMEMFEK